MDPLEVVKKHWVAKTGVFLSVACSVSECLANQQAKVLELSHSVTAFDLKRTIWQYFIAFLWFIFPGETFLVTSSILLNQNKEKLLLNHTYAYRMCGIDLYSMLLNYSLTKSKDQGQLPKIANWWTSLRIGSSYLHEKMGTNHPCPHLFRQVCLTLWPVSCKDSLTNRLVTHCHNTIKPKPL